MDKVFTPPRNMRKVESIGREILPRSDVIVDSGRENSINRHLNMPMSIYTIAVLNEFYAVGEH